MNITVKPSLVFRILLMIVAFLVLADVIGAAYKLYVNSERFSGFIRLFDLDAEINIPTFYQAITLLLSSMLLFMIAKIYRNAKKDYIAWLVLAIVFLFLSIDEASMIHEIFSWAVRSRLHTSGLLFDAWVIPYGIGVIIGAIIYIPFLMRLPSSTRWLLIASAIIYITGAMILEMFEGRYMAAHGTGTLGFAIYVVFEESGEMLGTALFIYTLLKYIAKAPVNSFTLTVNNDLQKG